MSPAGTEIFTGRIIFPDAIRADAGDRERHVGLLPFHSCRISSSTRCAAKKLRALNARSNPRRIDATDTRLCASPANQIDCDRLRRFHRPTRAFRQIAENMFINCEKIPVYKPPPARVREQRKITAACRNHDCTRMEGLAVAGRYFVI